MIKKIFSVLLLMTFFGSVCYGYSKEYSNELNKENLDFRQTIKDLTGNERRDAITDKRLEYEIRILEKQRSIYALKKKKDTMSPQEIRQQTINIQNEINSLRQAQASLR